MSVSLKKNTGNNFITVASGLFDTTLFEFEHNYSVAFLNSNEVSGATKGYKYLHFLYSGRRDALHKCLENSEALGNTKLNIKFNVKSNAPNEAKELQTIVSDTNNACFMDWNEMILYYVKKDDNFKLEIFRLNAPTNTNNKAIL